MGRLVSDLTGRQFGWLKVQRFAFVKGRHAYWHCKCRCGMEKDIRQDTLINGETVSCSCHKVRILKRRTKAMKARIAKTASLARWKRQG
jgi:hypothetical protein